MSAEEIKAEEAPVEVPAPSDNGKAEGVVLEMKAAQADAEAKPLTFTVSDQVLEQIEKTFSFSDLDDGQKLRQRNILNAAKQFALTVAQNVKQGHLYMEATQSIFRATLLANQSVQFEK